MIKSILVIADIAPGDVTALEKAHGIAGLFDATLQIVHFLPGQPGEESLDLADADAALAKDIAAVFPATARPAHQVVVCGDIAAWAAEACQRDAIDLVVKTGNRSERAFYTPTDWQLIRQLPCPVLIASTQKWRAKPVIMATVDLEDDSGIQQALNRRVMLLAAECATASDNELAVTYSLPVPKALLELDIIEQESYARKHRPKVEKLMQDFLAEVGLEDTAWHVDAGPPEKTLPSVANKLKAELVIMGSVGRQGLKGMLLGNTAEKVLRKLRTDILVVKPG